jgi:hypothetical protein
MEIGEWADACSFVSARAVGHKRSSDAGAGATFDYNVLMPEPDKNFATIPPDWLAEFEAAARRPLETRFRYSYIKTYKPVMDDARFRSFETMEEYRRWCEETSRIGSVMAAVETECGVTPRSAYLVKAHELPRPTPPLAGRC